MATENFVFSGRSHLHRSRNWHLALAPFSSISRRWGIRLLPTVLSVLENAASITVLCLCTWLDLFCVLERMKHGEQCLPIIPSPTGPTFWPLMLSGATLYLLMVANIVWCLTKIQWILGFSVLLKKKIRNSYGLSSHSERASYIKVESLSRDKPSIIIFYDSKVRLPDLENSVASGFVCS